MSKPIFSKNDLIILINDNIKLLKELDNSVNISLNSNVGQIIFKSDKEQLSRVFFNLIKNSIESINEKAQKDSDFDKKIVIELNDYDNHIVLIIEDNGVGFENLDMSKKEILNPYFTTKKGTGLGLSIANKIISDHDGNIEFQSKRGAKIKLFLIDNEYRNFNC